MNVTLINFELCVNGASEAVVRYHSAYGKLNEQLRTACLALLESFRFVTAYITRKAGVNFGSFFLAGYAHLVRIDHDDKVASVDVRSKNGFFFAAQDVGGFDRNATEHLIFGVDDPPLALHFVSFG